MTAETPAPSPGHSVKVPSDLTKYVLLERDGDTVNWAVVGRIAARSADAAVRKQAEKATGSTVLVAVPERNWAPQKVTPKQVTTFEVEAA